MSVISLMRVDTDAEGHFEGRGLIAGRYQVFVAVDCCNPLAAPGENSLGKPLGPRTVQLRADGRHDSLEIVAQRSRPMHAFGRVVVDPAWAKSKGVLGAPLNVRLELGVSMDRAKSVSHSLALDGDQFDFWIEGRELAVLTVELAGVLMTYPLFLVPQDAPGGSPQILSFP